ncbi:MAG: protein phosphatase 2C domain-containing protein, partial [Myxococcota bacterium]
APVEEVPVVMNFSPPEMFGRTRAEIGPQCDIFSLGSVLYFLIAGDLPPTSVYTRHTPAVPVRNFRPDFPVGLHSVIARATRPDPTERFQDVATMRDAFLRSCGYIEERLAHMREPPSPHIHLAVDTHVGITKRRRNPINQDAIFGQLSDDGKFGMVVVADGVSTASFGSGDLASDFLVKSAAQTWSEVLPLYLMNEQIDELRVIEQVLTRANNSIVDYVNANFPDFSGNPHEVMGTTALVVLIRDGIVTLGALGDSRGYLQRGTSFEQITIDHNLWTLSILDGVAADRALALPHGDALARCLGTFYIEEGTLVSVNPRPDIFRFPVMTGDTLLLTTDGLLDFAGSNVIHAEDNILAILLHEPNVDLACLEMILLANRGGGGDNIGLGLLRFY